MRTTYRSAPTMLCRAPAKSFATPLEALRHAREAADAFHVGYCVYETLAGRLRCLGRFRPNDRPA